MFGSFRLVPAQHLLLDNNAPVTLGTRALEILIALVNRAGELVTKEEIMAAVWPGTYVEESNLRVHVAALRKALRDGQDGARFILNVPGRGYSFVAAVQSEEGNRPAPGLVSDPADADWTMRLPTTTNRMFGRDATVEMLVGQLIQRRFVTLVGPGGIGKTTVAVAVARAMGQTDRDRVCFVDFSSIRDPTLVPGTVASALGLNTPSADVMGALLAYIAHRSLLLVLDNCEHVIEEAASTAEQIFNSTSAVQILCTSREPLRASGERVHRLPPLEGPSATLGLTAQEALSFPGIQLFVERAAAIQDGFSLSDDDAPVVAELCQRLDGIALAIELAAGRVAAFGLHELARRLDDRFRLLTAGRRTALPRHQTLAATLDWSYELLPPAGQDILCRLSVFSGEFTLEAATTTVAHLEPMLVVDQVADLISKSLIVADARSGGMKYHLLETTRLYAADKLRLSGQMDAARRAHAEHVRNVFQAAEPDVIRLPAGSWLNTYVTQLGNLRTALDWAAGAEGDSALLVALATAAVPLWVHLSLMAECRTRVEQALRALPATQDDDLATARARMQLLAAQGWSLMYAAGRSREIGVTWSAVLKLADRLDDTGYRLRAIWGVWISKLNNGELDAALALAQQLVDLTGGSTDHSDVMMADRLMGTILHYRGDQGGARRFMERMLDRYAIAGPQPRVARFHVDQQVTARYFYARILWLQGDVDQARAAVERNIREGQELGHALSYCSVLGQAACPIALFTGDLAAARAHASALIEHAEKYAIHLWAEWARCFDGLVQVRQGELRTGLSAMRTVLEAAGDSRFLPRYMVLLGEFAFATGLAGEPEEALSTLDAIAARCERSGERWYLPEVMRMRGEVMLVSGQMASDADAAICFQDAIRLANKQGARSWALRAATSLARMQQGAAQSAAARQGLAELYGTFAEGLETQDLVLARMTLKGSSE